MTEIRKDKIIKDHKVALKKNIQNQRQIQKRILFVPGNRTYADSDTYGKTILFIGDHIVIVKIHRLNNSFK